MSIKNILQKIKLVRISKNYSQKDMAEKLNVSTPTYSRFERGITKTSYDFLSKVCTVLDINVNNIDQSINIVEEFIPVYGENTIGNEANFQNEITILIDLLEKQQKTNKLILEKLKQLKAKSF